MTNIREAPRRPEELFPKPKLEGEVYAARAPEAEPQILPLGAFSNFVLNEQPGLLAGVRAGQVDAEEISERQRALIMGLHTNETERVMKDPKLSRVALLDLSFAMSGLTFSGITPPDEVHHLNAQIAQATGLPELMTFEKVVRINSRLPFPQMRTFTEGAVGETEKRFYYGHDLMDAKMYDTTNIAAQSIDTLRARGKEGADEVVDLLSRGAGNMSEFAEFMRSFMKMPREHFGEFRQYLSQYPDGTRNASGAFMGMPRLDIRLVGLSPMYECFLAEGMKYFPVDEQPDIHCAREMAREGHYLVRRCEALPAGTQRERVARALMEVINPITDFRLTHLAAVKRFVPQALPEGLRGLSEQLQNTKEEQILDQSTSVLKGTAGFLPGPLLRNILRLDLSALKRLNALLVNE